MIDKTYTIKMYCQQRKREKLNYLYCILEI